MLNRFHPTRLLASAGAIASFFVLPAGAQAANTNCPVSGTILENDFTAIQSDNWNGPPLNSDLFGSLPGTVEIVQFTHPITLTGGIAGVGFDQERAWAQYKTNDFTSHDKVAFDPAAGSGTPATTRATVSCPDGTTRTGGLTINFIATGNYAANAFTAHFEVIGSSGGLAGTTGNGTVTGEPGVPGGNGPYSGTLHLR